MGRSGRSNSDAFLNFMKCHFLKIATGRAQQDTTLVLYDGHKSHSFNKLIEYAKENKICSSSTLLQYFEVYGRGVFRPVQKMQSRLPFRQKYLRSHFSAEETFNSFWMQILDRRHNIESCQWLHSRVYHPKIDRCPAHAHQLSNGSSATRSATRRRRRNVDGLLHGWWRKMLFMHRVLLNFIDRTFPVALYMDAVWCMQILDTSKRLQTWWSIMRKVSI